MDHVLKGTIVFKIKTSQFLAQWESIGLVFRKLDCCARFQSAYREGSPDNASNMAFHRASFLQNSPGKSEAKERKAGFPPAREVFFHGKKVEGCLI